MDTDSDARSDAASRSEDARELTPIHRYLQAVDEAGFHDGLHTFDDLESRWLTRRRLEIIQYLADDSTEASSIRDLARQLDRQVRAVVDDLDVLVREGIVDYREEDDRKIPVLKRRHLFVRPILLEGEFQWDRVLEESDRPTE